MNENLYSDQQWQMLHDEIQKRFRALAAEIQIAVPMPEPRYGKTVTKLFPLFSHVSFKPIKAGTDDDIIVGVDIAPQDGQWRIAADVCEEESGTIFFELPSTPFSASSFQELMDRVLRTADQLVVDAKPVLLRLFGASAVPLSSADAPLADMARQTPV